jgi:nucleoside-diphosphate-sugar epimerase
VFGASGDWGRPDTLYGVLKICNEESARFYARDYQTPSIGLRPCVVYGPNRDQGLSAAVTHALKAVVLGEQYTIPFRGLIDLQYVEDVAEAFVAAALADQQGAPVYDLHGDLVEVADLVPAIELAVPEAAGRISVGRDPVPGRVDFDDAPLRATVGTLARTSLADGIRLTVDHFRRLRDDGSLRVADFRAAARVVPPDRR